MKGYLSRFSSFTLMVQEGNFTHYHGISDKVKSLIEEMLFLKNKKHAERTIAHICDVMVRSYFRPQPPLFLYIIPFVPLFLPSFLLYSFPISVISKFSSLILEILLKIY
jgi:hypothetical protein